MDDLEDKTKRNTNSAGENRQLRPDPIVQASDDYSRSGEGMQPTEIIPTAKKPISVADATLLPNQFMGTGGPTQAVPLGSDIIESMFRFKWTVLAVFILVAAPAIAAIWTQVVPKYRARAEVRVRPILPFLVFRTEDSGMIPLYDSFVNTQVSIIEGLVVLQRALDQEEVQETQWYKEPPKSLVQRLRGNPADPPMERLRDALSVKPRRETEIIDVTFMDCSAKDAKLIVDAVLDQYVKYLGEKSDATKDKLYSQLVDQYKSLENEILGREKISAELRRSLGTGAPQELVSAQRVRLDETQARLSELRNKIAILKWQVKQAGIDDSNDVAVASTDSMEKQPKYYEDAEWRRLDIDVRTIRHQIANSSLAANHPDMIRVTKDIEFAEELLRLREAQLDELWRNRPKNTAGMPITILGANGLSYEEWLIHLQHQLTQAKQEEQLLVEEYGKQQANFGELFETAQLLEKENNALLHKRELFSAVRQRLDQKNMERNVPGSIEVLMWAFVPPKPYKDRRIALTAMALVMGLGMGGGAAFLRASRNQAIYTPKDMPHPMQVPFLGYIPVTRTRRSSDDEVSPALIESIRFVRTALLSRLDGQGSTTSTTVLVTSADVGTGKTTFTMMLGESLAQAGNKVLVIDADLRKMALTKGFDLSDKPGFVESLCSRSIDKRHIFPMETSGLSIMPAGNRGDDGAVFEEIANGAFETCIGELRKQYNIILLDSSPILTLADATILSSQVDGTIMVERELVSRRGDMIEALARLGSAGGRLLGTVFIGSSSHEKYGYHYHYSRTSESYL